MSNSVANPNGKKCPICKKFREGEDYKCAENADRRFDKNTACRFCHLDGRVQTQYRGVRPEGREWCRRCREWRLKEDFEPPEQTRDVWDDGLFCTRCQEAPPDLPDVRFGLRPWERKFLRAYLENGNIRQAARYAGVAKETAQMALNGRDRSGIRQAFQYMLEREGMDLFALVNNLRACFHATEVKFNPETREMEKFPDYKTRLRTAQTVAKLHELEAPIRGPSVGSGGMVQVNFITNLGDKTEVVEDAGTITIEAERGE